MRVAKKITLLFFASFVAISILTVQCTPEKKFRVLSFIFDGVPDPSKKTELVYSSSSDSIRVLSNNNGSSELHFHPPYFEKKCKSCHQGGTSNALLMPMPDLCYTCHEDFNVKFQTLHGPVAAGYCTACHNQHESKLNKLLVREGQQICLFCHVSKDIMRNKIHSNINIRSCTECHNPHGGENRGILMQGICYNCHENFDSKYNYLHGPVASGNCLGCHDSHSSGAEKLISRKGEDLCLFCHKAEDVFKNNVHKKSQKKNCTECHNPHGGGDRYILTSAIRPFTVKPSAKKEIESKPDSVPKIIPEKTNVSDSTITNPLQPDNNKTPEEVKEKTNTDSVPKVIPEKTGIKDTTLTKPLILNKSNIPENTKEKSKAAESKTDVVPINNTEKDGTLQSPTLQSGKKISNSNNDTIQVNWSTPKK